MSIVKCLVGSHNYGLQDADSDRDYKLFVMPTFDDLYRGNMYAKSTLGDTEDVDVHDIRKVVSLWWKSNVNFIEVLYSTDVQFLYDAPELRELWDMRADIVSMNLPYLYKACGGLHLNKMKYLEKGTEKTQHLVDKFGYSTKEALHAYRILDFIVRYAVTGFADFNYAMQYPPGAKREFMMDIKHGAYTLERYKKIVQMRYGDYQALESVYMEQQPREDVKERVDELVYAMVKRLIREE